MFSNFLLHLLRVIYNKWLKKQKQDLEKKVGNFLEMHDLTLNTFNTLNFNYKD